MTELLDVSIKWPYYHRETANDKAPDSSALTNCLHFALLIIPNLCKPLSKPIALGVGTLRTWKYWNKEDILNNRSQLSHAFVATTALTATFFRHPLGMMITTAQDLYLELSQLAHVLQTTQDSQKIQE